MQEKKSSIGCGKTHGGYRKGAGRKPSNRPSKAVKIPLDMVDEVKTFIKGRHGILPLSPQKVVAGVPDYVEAATREDFNILDYLMPHPEKMILEEVYGDSMIGAKIYEGDYLVVDTTAEPLDKSIVVAIIDNEKTVKRLRYLDGQPHLVAENKKYKPIPIGEHNEVYIIGTVTRRFGPVE